MKHGRHHIIGSAQAALVAAFLCSGAMAEEQAEGGGVHVVDDRALAGRLASELGRRADDGGLVPAAELRRQLAERSSCRIDLPAGEGAGDALDGAQVYERCADSVLVVGGIYKCNRCSNWHTSTASGFVLTPDGIVATNHHVIKAGAPENEVVGFGVMTRGGRVLPVTEVLASDEESDAAIIRVDVGDAPLDPLPLGVGEPVGAPVWIISHPDEEYFFMTGGMISRYARSDDPSNDAEWMAVTAEFAKGSSGGPVINARGEVCGMVAHTRSVYYRGGTGGKENSPFQMTLRSCVPAAAILALIESGGVPAAQLAANEAPPVVPLPGTAPLDWDGDIASRLVDSAHGFLDRKRDEASASRIDRYWRTDGDPGDLAAGHRARLRRIIGAVDQRADPVRFENLGAVAQGEGVVVSAVRWSAFGDVCAEGLLLEPKDGTTPVADVVVLPDADFLPEASAGLVDGLPQERQLARILAARGCRVLVPALVDRSPRHQDITRREFLYRSAFELGRHIIGYEVQKVLAGIDWLKQTTPDGRSRPVAVAGFGEGGLLALHAAALDERIDECLVAGYFGPRENAWDEPADRNVFGFVDRFGDCGAAALIAPRRLIVDPIPGPEIAQPAGGRAKPGRAIVHSRDAVEAEAGKAREMAACLGHPDGGWLSIGGTDSLLRGVGIAGADGGSGFAITRELPDAGARQERAFHELDRHNQHLLTESPYVRKDFWKDLKTESPEAFAESVQPYRDYFAREVIGTFDEPMLAPNPRTRLVDGTESVDVYEVVLDVHPGLFAYGLLLVPKGIAPGENRPVVVCQHGLEGRPQFLVGEGEGFESYKAYAMRLAERGFVTFAPQNLYLFHDRFRLLQFKANALGATLFSLIIPQHRQITEWLAGLPFVDGNRIGFYGLSYGGKSAMRIPPLVDRYCLSICSADFNDWVWKNASSRSPYSYVWTGEYEIFEFDLGSTFNYAEMAALIAPRPFMVERGHFDGVAPDETVAAEFAKVRHLYAARLGLENAAEIEWFVGPHTINGQETFRFLHRHLDWPEP